MPNAHNDPRNKNTPANQKFAVSPLQISIMVFRQIDHRDYACADAFHICELLGLVFFEINLDVLF